jgi:hypothetical protein
VGKKEKILERISAICAFKLLGKLLRSMDVQRMYLIPDRLILAKWWRRN